MFFFLNYEALIERLGRTVSTVVPDDNARLGILPTRHGRRQPRGRARSSPSSRAPTAPRSARGSLSTPSLRADARPAVRAGPHRPQRRRRTSSSRATPSTTRTSSCRPTTRSSPASSCRATSSSPASTGRCCRDDVQHDAARLQPHAHRPECRSQHLAAAAAVRARAGDDRRHRHRRHEAVRAAELREPAAGAERVQRAGRPGPHARPAPDQGRRRWSSTTRTTWSIRPSAWASTPSRT